MFELKLKQVRTNIGLADTSIPSSFVNIKFGVNRMFHVLKTTVYGFDLYEKYHTLWTDEDNFW